MNKLSISEWLGILVGGAAMSVLLLLPFDLIKVGWYVAVGAFWCSIGLAAAYMIGKQGKS